MATQVQSRGGGTAHPGALATAGGQSLKEITKALQVAKFDALGALNGLVIAKRISEHCYGATRTYRLRAETAAWKQLDSALTSSSAHQYYYQVDRPKTGRLLLLGWAVLSCPAPS